MGEKGGKGCERGEGGMRLLVQQIGLSIGTRESRLLAKALASTREEAVPFDTIPGQRKEAHTAGHLC